MISRARIHHRLPPSLPPLPRKKTTRSIPSSSTRYTPPFSEYGSSSTFLHLRAVLLLVVSLFLREFLPLLVSLAHLYLLSL